MPSLRTPIKALFFTGFFFVQGLFASNHSIDAYLEYLSSHHLGRRGDYTKGEMQIVDRREEILEIQKRYYNEFLQKGCSPEEAEKYSRVGVIEEDARWVWLRDPLILPNGKTTAHNRFFPKNQLFHGVPGVSVMAISDTKEILVNVIFRHATREWEIELPRGGVEKDETPEKAALRELREETGVRANKAVKIASIAPDSGTLASTLDIFVVNEIALSGERSLDDCEVIHDCLFLSKQALKQAFVDGVIELEIGGNRVKVFCRDPFLASALLVAEAKSLL